ncbi:MAG TPA: GLUG motif-containing protein [Sedimentisphaerales bacterium]|nr:GLUG motif-containing protein [Sedimentisphaerales bacterium]
MPNSNTTLSLSGLRKHSGKLTMPLVVLLAICLFGRAAEAQYDGGTGEPNDPYLIYTAEQMNEIGADANDWDKQFKLMADIDLSAYTETDFNIIGTSFSNSFTGVFDGSGKKIYNFTYTSTGANNIGLFGYVRGENAVIKDLGLIDPNVDAGAGKYTGSLVGRIQMGTVTGCYAQGGSVSGERYVGGLVGQNEDFIFRPGMISTRMISNCYSTGIVSGRIFVGGLVGVNRDGTITNCYSTGSVSENWGVGGLVGYNSQGTITNCYSTGSVAGRTEVGGLVGWNDRSGTITNCYSIGSATGTRYVGGLVGNNSQGTITNCYSMGGVTGTMDVGGLVGKKSSGWVVTSFWDTQTSGQLTSAGGTGKTTVQMQTISTFTSAGWDFWNLWTICEGMNYPVFFWQIPVVDFLCPDGVDFIDFAFFANHWGQNNCNEVNYYCEGTDLDFSGTVDEADLEIFFDNWLAGVE